MELEGLIARMGHQGGRVVLPIWHGVTVEKVLEHLPIVADLVAISTENGIDNVISKLVESVGRQHNDTMFIDGTWYSEGYKHELYIAGWSKPTVGVYQFGGIKPHGVYRGILLDEVYHYHWNWINGKEQGGGRLIYSTSHAGEQLEGEWWFQNTPQSRIQVKYKRVSNDMPSWLTLSKLKSLLFKENSPISGNSFIVDKSNIERKPDPSIYEPIYRVPELRRNGDFILLIWQMMQDVVENGWNEENKTNLSKQLEELFTITGIRQDFTYYQNIEAITKRPITALRVASVARKLAFSLSLSDHKSNQEHSLNLLRRDILLGVAGVKPTLGTMELERCLGDYKELMFCLSGAMSDVASSASEKDKPIALDSYRRVCEIVFR